MAEALLPNGEDIPGFDAEQLADYQHYLQELRRFSPYTLDERSEQIINLKNTNGVVIPARSENDTGGTSIRMSKRSRSGPEMRPK